MAMDTVVNMLKHGLWTQSPHANDVFQGSPIKGHTRKSSASFCGGTSNAGTLGAFEPSVA